MDDPAFFQHWGLAFSRFRDDLKISGSPNRTLARRLFEDASGKLFILEEYDLRKKAPQIAQNRLLDFFRDHQLPGIYPALQTVNGDHGVTYQRSFRQVRPWVDADPLDRTTLGENTALARQWAQFLLKLKEISAAPDLPPPHGGRFSLAAYTPKILHFTRRNMPELYDDLQAVIRQLQPFFSLEDQLPAMFAHGDFHPGNVLLKNNTISAVIDWEFLGWKCAGYDLALLLGCLGMDDPDWLDGAAVRTLQDHLFMQDYMPPAAWQALPQLMAAIRLGWFGEWVDLQDRPTAQQEIAYIRFLLG